MQTLGSAVTLIPEAVEDMIGELTQNKDEQEQVRMLYRYVNATQISLWFDMNRYTI